MTIGDHSLRERIIEILQQRAIEIGEGIHVPDHSFDEIVSDILSLTGDYIMESIEDLS